MSFSPKQKQILTFPYESDYDALICDGAVRSGKTSIMSLSFVLWMMAEFNHCSFAFCGKSVGAVERNIVQPLLSVRYLQQQFQITYNRSGHVLTVQRGSKVNMVYLFGGKDESSYMLIQGITLAGVLLDEVALMPRSFVEQALSRAISFEHPKYFFNCNPESPSHWFYKEWIERPRENTQHIHFLLEDNPILTPQMIERTKGMYSGVFYDRYILGRWVIAEGLVYPMFGENCIVHDGPDDGDFYISIDYGTRNPFSAGLWRVTKKCAVRVAEVYYSGRAEHHQKTDEEYCDMVEQLAGDRTISAVVVDPSAASFIEALRRRGRFKVRHADNDVMNGIRTVSAFLKNGKIKIHESCENSIREFGLYRWDDKAREDQVIKDNDHAMDDIRYMAMTVLKKAFKEHSFVPELAR